MTRFFGRGRIGEFRVAGADIEARPMLPHPDDDRIPEVAVRTRSPIVTSNIRDFRGCESFGIRTMSPGELLAVAREPLYRWASEVAASENISVDDPVRGGL